MALSGEERLELNNLLSLVNQAQRELCLLEHEDSEPLMELVRIKVDLEKTIKSSRWPDMENISHQVSEIRLAVIRKFGLGSTAILTNIDSSLQWLRQGIRPKRAYGFILPTGFGP